jgi:hypothetical protein
MHVAHALRPDSAECRQANGHQTAIGDAEAVARQDRCRDVRQDSAAPALVCPSCDRPLRYRRSHIGGVSERLSEQWDYFDCVQGCGTFQYRQRTRKVRRVE